MKKVSLLLTVAFILIVSLMSLPVIACEVDDGPFGEYLSHNEVVQLLALPAEDTVDGFFAYNNC